MGTEDSVSDNNENIISDLEKKIIRQVEYYFGNYNLGKDKFLREQIKLDDGWVSLEIMTKFRRLKSLSDNYTVITDALKKSPAQLMEVNDDCTKIRRSLEKPLPDESDSRRDEIDDRSIYVKGFKTDTSLDELLDFFKQYNVENITMRRRPNKAFKGSVFITFENQSDANTFYELKDVKYNNIELLKEHKKDYCQRKALLHEEFIKDKERKKQKRAEQQENEPDIPEPSFTKGCLIKLTGLGSGFTRENIKEGLETHGTIVYVDFSKGQSEAIVRFETAVAASIIENASTEDDTKVIEINSEKITVFPIEGEEESNYWKTIVRNKSFARQKYKEKHSRGQWGKGGRFNKKNRGKRHGFERDNEADVKSEEPAQKKIKGEALSDVSEVKSEQQSPSKKIKFEGTSDEPNGVVEKSKNDNVAVKTE